MYSLLYHAAMDLFLCYGQNSNYDYSYDRADLQRRFLPGEPPENHGILKGMGVQGERRPSTPQGCLIYPSLKDQTK